MSLLLTFMELDKLYESANRLDRNAIIRNIKELGKEYNFDKYSDEQLYRMLERAKKEAEEKAAIKEYNDLIKAERHETCSECGAQLNDSGACPVCDDGEEHLFEWVDASGNKVKQLTSPTSVAQQPQSKPSSSSNNIVTIVYDTAKHKLRAQADDGVHGIGNVAFPNNLRTKAGQQYEVEALIWNGKNYRVSGAIKPI